MRDIDVKDITQAVKDICISANLELSDEMQNSHMSGYRYGSFLY